MFFAEHWIPIVIVVAVLLLIILASYIKAPPSYAYIVSGLYRKPRIYIGKGGLRIPFLERMDKVFLGQVTGRYQDQPFGPDQRFY